MSDNAVSTIFCLVFIFVLSFFLGIGCSIGHKHGIDKIKQEAVDNNVAEWKVDQSDGRKYFEWIKPSGVQQTTETVSPNQ